MTSSSMMSTESNWALAAARSGRCQAAVPAVGSIMALGQRIVAMVARIGRGNPARPCVRKVWRMSRGPNSSKALRWRRWWRRARMRSPFRAGARRAVRALRQVGRIRMVQSPSGHLMNPVLNIEDGQAEVAGQPTQGDSAARDGEQVAALSLGQGGEVLHDLPMAGHAGDSVVQVETSPVRLSRFESVGWSNLVRIDEYGLSSPLWSDCVVARARPSGCAGSVSLMGCRRECGKRGYHLRLLPESPLPSLPVWSFASAYLTASCAVPACALLGSASAPFSFGAVFGTSEWGSGRPIPVLEIIVGEVEKNRAAR